MDREILRAQRQEARQRKKRRRTHRVDNRGQLRLLELEGEREWKAREIPAGVAEERRYVDPDPSGILFGNEDLGSYLEKRGEKRTIALRKLLRGLKLEGLHKKPPASGRPPYHPASMVGLILLGLLEGKSSLRQLETLARTDVRACWISGGIQPDHSVIGRFIQEHREELSEGFFVELTRQVLQQSRSWGGDLAGDGTVIQAAGSGYRRVQREAAEQAAREAEEASRRHPQDARLKRRKEEARQVAELVQQRQKQRQQQYKSGEVSVSPSDPEAVIQPLKAPGGTAPSYKPVVLSNAQQMVVAQNVDASCEHAVYTELLEQARRSSGEVKRVRLDAAYFNFDVLRSSARRKIELLCPEGKTTDEGGQAKQTERYHKSVFVYDEKQDCYHCPAGQRLVPLRRSQQEGRAYIRYGGASCQDCTQREQCTNSGKGRTLKRYEEEALKDQLRARMKLPQAQQEYQKRKTMVEPVFARIKQHQGLRRFKRRGLANVRVEFALWAAAHNVARWWALQPDDGRFQTLFKMLCTLLSRVLRTICCIPANLLSFESKHAERLICFNCGS